jgi:ribosomal protein L7Ae-like RNA K-turn-binding protein
MGGKKRKLAATLDDLSGDASKRVAFIRADARAAVSAPAGPSRTQLKAAAASPFDPQWPLVRGETASALLQRIGTDCVAREDGATRARSGVVVGLGAVSRALRRGALSAVVLAHDSGPPLFSAHVPVLAQKHGTAACVLACASAQLGQPFGLLRAATVGLDAALFPPEHGLVRMVADAGGETGVKLKGRASTPRG